MLKFPFNIQTIDDLTSDLLLVLLTINVTSAIPVPCPTVISIGPSFHTI